MLEQGIIQPSTSEWAAPLLYVANQTTSCGLPKTEQYLKSDSYPLPHIDDLIDNLGKMKFISALDLTKGHWQVPI